MGKEIKFLGVTWRKGSVELKQSSTPSSNGKKRSAKDVIRRIPKREVSFQIADIKVALQMAKNVDTPDRSKLLQICEYIMKDSHLKSQLRLAKIKVLSEPWQLYKDDTPNEAATKDFSKRWFNTVLEYILESEFYGFTLIEMDKIDPANFAIGEVLNFPREYVSIEKQWILIEGTINGSYLDYSQIMQDIDLLEFGRRDDFGILLECAYNVIYKFYSRADWSRASEKFGMPILVIEADTNNDTEIDNLENRAANFGSDGYIVVQNGDKASIVERTGQRMHDIYLDCIKLCNEEVSKVVNGQTGSSDPKAFVGAAEVQERTMDDFTLARLQNIVDEVNEKFLPYLRLKGFSLDENLRLDYPALIAERKKKIEGKQTPTDPKQVTADPKKEETK